MKIKSTERNWKMKGKKKFLHIHTMIQWMLVDKNRMRRIHRAGVHQYSNLMFISINFLIEFQKYSLQIPKKYRFSNVCACACQCNTLWCMLYAMPIKMIKVKQKHFTMTFIVNGIFGRVFWFSNLYSIFMQLNEEWKTINSASKSFLCILAICLPLHIVFCIIYFSEP